MLDAVPEHALARQVLPPESTSELPTDVGEAELDRAFAVAEARPDEMLDADGVAQATMRALEDEAEPEGVAPAADSPFATRTMVNLLEQQGHGDEAERLRAALPSEDASGDGPRERVVETLEGWLENLRKRTP